MKKRGKRIKLLITILIILVILLILVIISLNKNISGKVIFNPTIPTDCSNDSIKALWNSIFNEPSTDIIIFTNTSEPGKCSFITAYKIKNDEAFILSGVDMILFGNLTVITGIRGNFTEEYLNILRAISNASAEVYLNSSNNPIIQEKYIKPRTFNLAEANVSFKTSFKKTPGNWIINNSDLNKVFYNYDENITESSTNTIKINEDLSFANYSIDYVGYVKIITSIPSCTPNWQEQNTTCNSSETILTYYTDSNYCGTTTSQPFNKTQNCNFNNDSIFGNPEDFKTKIRNSMHEQVTLYINGTSNLSSQNFTNQNIRVEIKNSNATYVDFYWNFSVPLDLNNIYIEKYTFVNKSYILIKNLHVNKTVYLNSFAYSGKICIKDEEISSISAINPKCIKSNEILLTCPESDENISCEVDEDGFRIMGLTNSGVIEYIENASCIENWNYSAWSNCTNNLQTRNATDLSYCGTTLNKDETTQPCGTDPPDITINSSCTPSWNCSAWSECINDTQTKTCTDNNNCKPDKEQSQSCSASFLKLTNYIYIGLIITLIIAIVIILISLIITFFNHNSRKGGVFSSSPIKFSARSIN